MTTMTIPNVSGVGEGMRDAARRAADGRFYKFVAALNGAVPGALLAWDAYRHQLGANPVNFAIRTTGLLSLIFLVLSLAVTPARRLTGWGTLVNYRRWLGLWGFLYALGHFAIFFFWDREGSISSTIKELLSRTYLLYGSAALVLMMPLAATSFDRVITRMGGVWWKRLHRLAYLIVPLGALHYYLLAKADKRQPLVFAGVLAALLLARLVWHYVDLRRRAGVSAKAAVAAPATRKKFWRGELEVVATFDETPTVRTFRMGVPGGGELPFGYLPGQYVTLELTVAGKPVRRSYTIASSPTRVASMEITVKREEMGVSSGHLHRTVKCGDRIKIAAPAGKFVFTGDGEKGVLLIGGGVGITPVMSMLRYLMDRSWKGEIYFVRVARSEAERIFDAELGLLENRFPNLHVLTVLTQPGEGWRGERGRLNKDVLSRFVPGIERMPAFLCGPDGMMAATRGVLMDLGVPGDRVFTEAFVSPASSEVSKGAASGVGGGAPAESALCTFASSGKTAELSPDVTVLEAAEAVGVRIPFECRSGVCGQCKTKLVEGNVIMPVQDALTSSDRKAGVILACQARAVTSEVVVEA